MDFGHFVKNNKIWQILSVLTKIGPNIFQNILKNGAFPLP